MAHQKVTQVIRIVRVIRLTFDPDMEYAMQGPRFHAFIKKDMIQYSLTSLSMLLYCGIPTQLGLANLDSLDPLFTQGRYR